MPKRTTAILLPGASKDTFNLTGYFENKCAALVWPTPTVREFFVTFDRTTPLNQDSLSSLDASVVVNVMPSLALTFDAINMTDEKITQFAGTPDQPRAIYDNGADLLRRCAREVLNLQVRFPLPGNGEGESSFSCSSRRALSAAQS